MNFPVIFLRPLRQPASQPGAAPGHLSRIISLLGVLLTAGLLQACGAIKIVYNQAPDLAYWYLDGYADFNGAQSLQVKEELARLQAWHRRTQLPGYIEALHKLQQQMPVEMDSAQACEIFADVRHRLIMVAEQAEPAVVSLAVTLDAAQVTHMERKFAKANADYRDDFLDTTPKASRNKRYKDAVKRAELLYGRLDKKQLEAVGAGIDNSGFDATLAYAERLRRQQDILQTLRALPGEGAAAAKPAVRALFQRSISSPNPAYRSYLDKFTHNNCKSFADLHNSTSAAQRKKAADVINGYMHDFRSLMAQK